MMVLSVFLKLFYVSFMIEEYLYLKETGKLGPSK